MFAQKLIMRYRTARVGYAEKKVKWLTTLEANTVQSKNSIKNDWLGNVIYEELCKKSILRNGIRTKNINSKE